jgi:hypothetical protein
LTRLVKTPLPIPVVVEVAVSQRVDSRDWVEVTAPLLRLNGGFRVEGGFKRDEAEIEPEMRVVEVS